MKDPEETNIEEIVDADFDLTTGRYKTIDESIVSCVMLDNSIVFTIGDDENGI